MKFEKKWVIFGIILLMGIFLINFVSAEVDFQSAANDIIRWIGDIFAPFFQALIGGQELGSDLFFFKILFMILVFVVCKAALSRVDFFKRSRATVFLVSIIIAIIGARYLTEASWIQAIIMSYNVVTISLITFLPMLVYGYLIHESTESSLGRRFGWIIIAGIFIGMWIDKMKELPSGANVAYLIAIILIFICILFDGTIHDYFGLAAGRKAQIQRIDGNIANLDTQLNYLYSNTDPGPETQRRIDALQKRIDDLRQKRSEVGWF